MITHWYEDANLVGVIFVSVTFPVIFVLFYFRPEWANRIWRDFPLFGRRLSPRTWRIIAYIILISGIYQIVDILIRYFSN